ncbi:MAG TPA: ectoine/hydroxyectoine ABC transporter substrate-binding protein EhuB [Ruminococcaceae bacterium]|jgi:polar amino acid transport system substrate-binding protein|nr:ectoine/hydroxyectoine ABC transporter substrate-binding protein EhuB [Oscillospiraceae bacterium]
MNHFVFVRKHNRFVAALLSAVLLLTLLAGCAKAGSASASGSETTLEKARRLGYVTVGFAQEKPYAYQTEDGKLTGEAVDVARTILKELGIDEMRGELTEFGSLIPGLNAKRYDMVTAGMFITPDRAKEVSFANPEFTIGEAIAVQKGNPLNLHSYKDIAENPTAKIAVPAGAIEYDYLVSANVPKARIVIVPNITAALSALQSDRAHALTATGPSVQSAIDTSGSADIERVSDFQQPVVDGKSVRGYGATAFRKADKDFVSAFNKGLEELKKSGKLLEILKKFGFTETELPGSVTTEKLLESF